MNRRHANLIYGLSILFIVLFFGFYFFVAGKEKPDPATNCYKTVSGKFVVLIDKTDVIPEQTQVEISKRAWASIEKNTKMGDLISVYEIKSDSLSNLTPVFQMCRPKSANEASQLTESVRSIERKFREKFEKPLKDILSKNTGQAQNSPIAEALMDISLSDSLRDANPGRIILFSDMMQHSSNVSTYGCTRPDDPINKFKISRTGSTMRPTFINTFVELHVIPRHEIKASEVACRNVFWNWFFGDMRGREYGRDVLDLPGSYGAVISETKGREDHHD